MAARYQRPSGIGEQQVGDERMLLDEGANRVHVLNGTAAFIWDRLEAPITVEEIARRMADEYDLTGVADIQGTIRRVLGDLLEKGLVLRLGAD
jgi:hypothetical protein